MYVAVQVNLGAVEHFIRVVGEKEDAIFQRRMRMLQRDKRRREQDKVGSPPGRHQALGHHAQAEYHPSQVTTENVCTG